MSNIIFQVEGGIGKNILSTAVVRAINNEYPDDNIIVVTAHPDIWRCNPRVNKVLQFGESTYFYQDYMDKDVKLFIHDPYRCEDYILRKKHLTEIWCDMYDLKYDGEKPELYFTGLEYDFLKTLINKDKPIFLIQAFGGAPNQEHKYSWARDIPPKIAQEVVNDMSKDYRVIQVRREDQIGLDGVEYLSLNPRQLAMVIMLSDKRLFIDSFMQHASSALGLSAVVTWVANSPDVLGYGIHHNLIADNLEPGDLKASFYDAFDIVGDPIQLATPPETLFDSKKIIDALRNGYNPPVASEFLTP